jgi:alkyl sulfatase BDS1-like metallo-beta-lactamase superfamily hydrolase
VVADGRVSAATEAEIRKPLLSADQVADMANIWWDSYLQGVAKGRRQDAQKLQDMRLFLKGMALSLNPNAARDLKAVIQFEVSGEQPGNWYLSIADGKCACMEGIADNPTLTISTPSEIWIAIANGELDGQQAFMEGKYAARGDVSLLMRMKNLFAPA